MIAHRNTVSGQPGADSRVSAPPAFLAVQLESKSGLEALQLTASWCGVLQVKHLNCARRDAPRYSETGMSCTCVWKSGGGIQVFASLPRHGTERKVALLEVKLTILHALRQCFNKFQMMMCNSQIPVCQKKAEQQGPVHKSICYFCQVIKSVAWLPIFLVSSAISTLTIEKTTLILQFFYCRLSMLFERS